MYVYEYTIKALYEYKWIAIKYIENHLTVYYWNELIHLISVGYSKNVFWVKYKFKFVQKKEIFFQTFLLITLILSELSISFGLPLRNGFSHFYCRTFFSNSLLCFPKKLGWFFLINLLPRLMPSRHFKPRPHLIKANETPNVFFKITSSGHSLITDKEK